MLFIFFFFLHAKQERRNWEQKIVPYVNKLPGFPAIWLASLNQPWNLTGCFGLVFVSHWLEKRCDLWKKKIGNFEKSPKEEPRAWFVSVAWNFIYPLEVPIAKQFISCDIFSAQYPKINYKNVNMILTKQYKKMAAWIIKKTLRR